MKSFSNSQEGVNVGRGFINGSLAGVVTGLLMVGINHLTAVFAFEGSLLQSLATFAVGGALFGILSGLLMSVLMGRLPFGIFGTSVMISVAVWTSLRTVGVALAGSNPFRFHSDISQTIQGFGFAILLGCVLAAIWKMGEEKAA